jgi:endonuclease G
MLENEAFLVAYDEERDNPAWVRVIAFVMPNEKCKGELEDYLVPVYEVEEKTGLDFYWELEDGVEDALEKESASAMWD